MHTPKVYREIGVEMKQIVGVYIQLKNGQLDSSLLYSTHTIFHETRINNTYIRIATNYNFSFLK